MKAGVRIRRVRAALAALAVAVALISFILTREPESGAGPLERQAEAFVGLALSLGQQRAQEVDAYFGPSALASRGKSDGADLAGLLRRSQSLRADIEAEEVPSLRLSRLRDQVRSFSALVEVLNAPGQRDFDDEAQQIYGMAPVVADAAGSTEALQTLEALLPGTGSLAMRVATFRNQFIVPAERRKAVFERALHECRTRTLAKWNLPANEKLDIVWTRDVPAAWHRYEGNAHSTLKLNAAAVSFLGSAIDVACHEGYPGHHAQFVVMDASAGAKGPAVEDTVVLLRSPISMLREGAATYGVELAFSSEERLAFERDVLFPLAGLDPSHAEKYARVHRLVDELSANVVPILRDYRDKRLVRELASRALESRALVSSPESLLRFVDELGPYVLGYTVARDRVRGYIEAQAHESGEDRWVLLHAMLAQADVSPLGRAGPAAKTSTARLQQGAGKTLR